MLQRKWISDRLNQTFDSADQPVKGPSTQQESPLSAGETRSIGYLEGPRLQVADS